jgi:3-hydroxybutyryl-CoA dehydratase
MRGLPIEALAPGMAAEITKTYDEWDVWTFAALTGDLNPAHVDAEFAERTVFRSRVAHGMLTASLISAVLGTRLPGPGTIYLSQELRFLRPVRIGDTVTARVEVLELTPAKNLARLKTTCTNQHGQPLLDGTALVMPPRVALDDARGAEQPPGSEDQPTHRPPEARPAPALRGSGRRRGWLVGQRMTPDPITVAPDAPLADAQELMARHGIRHLPVVDDGRLVGVVTESDLRRASLPGAGGPERDAMLRLVRAADVMSADPVTVGPDRSIGDAARLLVTHKVGSVPVVDRGRLVGILTTTDALEALVELVGSGEGG